MESREKAHSNIFKTPIRRGAVLAPTDYSPVRLHYFHGSEEENFKDLIESLEDYFGTRKVKHDYQKQSNLPSLLKGIAKINFNKKHTDLTDLKYDDVILHLKNKYSSTKANLKMIEAIEKTFQFPK
ncbi:hypothetical protein BD560DRAFT_439871 [Blakeslea trispora]|nr:hypothetical protein BD560DRAFT_439871 [Blakeslea trispora]